MTTQIDGTKGVVYPDGFYQSNANSGEGALTQFYYPAAGSAYQDCYRAGFLPSWFNQQWGGAQWGTLPDGSFGSVATGNVQDDSALAIGAGAGQYFVTQGIKLGENETSPPAWLKVYKVGNPTTLTVSWKADNGSGLPTGADVGGSATLAGKQVTSKTDGEFYSFAPTPGALAGGTKYHVCCTQGGVDASNYFVVKSTTRAACPHGQVTGGTSGGVFTPISGSTLCFLIQNPAANSLIQSSGMFDYKLAFNPGTPVNQSRSVAQPLANFYDGKTCSVLYRGTFAVSTNVWDFTYGIDHDRITLTINASGYPVLTIYESDRTVATVTGTGSVASGNHDVGIRVRTVADGADYATLYVDGVSVGTPLTAQTFTMAAEMVRLGTARLGDGFGLAPTWTLDQQMTGGALSTQGWTCTVSLVTEANAYSFQNNKLYQNKNAFDAAGAASYAYYSRTTPPVFVNATGWAFATKLRVPANTNTAGNTAGCYFTVADGSKIVNVNVHEYFLYIGSTGTPDFYIQGDFKSQEHVFTLQGKGSDYYLFVDGKLAVDGTGKLTAASATNNVSFGDGASAASENADAIWSYVKYYQGGMILPAANTGTCSEFAHWSGDKSALFPSLWNSGTPVSVKQLCGVPRNYQFEQVVQREVRRGVTNVPTTTSTAYVLQTDQECYSVGGAYAQQATDTQYNSTATIVQLGSYIDGVQITDQYAGVTGAGANYAVCLSNRVDITLPLGLHKHETRWTTTGGTATSSSTRRSLTVEARS